MADGKLEQLQSNSTQPIHEEPLLNYVVHGRPAFASVTVTLDLDEEVIGDGGALLWADGDLSTEAYCPGGCGAACMRSWSGEHCYSNKFTGPGKVTFGFKAPGDMLTFGVTPGSGWVLTQKAFIAGTKNILVSSRFTGCCSSIHADEGLFLTKITVKDSLGMFWAGGFGEIVRHEIPAGKTLYVDNGLFFAAHEKTNFRLAVVGGGINSWCCSGEGIVMQFHGPAVVYTQSRNPELWEAVNDGPPPETHNHRV